uniref:Acyl-CoA dehydrogenase family member 10 n=1 Tax=Phallusia mammillata TaxID=59560 RepID=A0A6F9D519_9ASCI|nr:acyl-CoA dehydrogenase family member 10 [Phallusia mammillata]
MSIARLCSNGRFPLLHRAICHSSIKSSRWKCRAVIFDMGGVILPSPFPMTREYEAMKKIPAGTIWKSIKEHGNEGAWMKMEIGELSADDFGQVFSDECTKTANEPIDVKDFLLFLENGMKNPVPEVLDAVECLRESGIKTALLTNNWKYSDGRSLLPFSKEKFDVVVESAVEGMNKPQPVIYNLCLNRLRVQPSEAIFLDDMLPNILAAKSLGIHTIKVDDVYSAVGELERFLDISLSSVTKGTRPVRKGMEFDLEKFTEYVNDKLNIKVDHQPEVRQFSHGQSNPTYLIDFGPNYTKYVLRKKPPGKLLPSAHAIEREYRIMHAVQNHGVKVPPLVDLCEDSSIIGTPFYMMELVQGNIYKNPTLPGMIPETRKIIYEKMISTLCDIHKVDINAAGLQNYGKQGNYVERQVKTWTKQYRASETHKIASMEQLIEWLPQHLPQNEQTTIVHGDYRVDNLIYGRDQSEVLAVLDWELSTLGDPISDVAYCCLPHFLPQNFPIIPGFKNMNLQELGIPTHNQIIDMYCEKMNIPKIDNIDFYMAFSFFRVAAILQGVYKRSSQGQASSAQASSAGKLAESMSDIGWSFAAKEGFRLFKKADSLPLTSGNPQRRQYSTQAANFIPLDVTALRQEVQDLHAKLNTFMERNVYPNEAAFRDHSLSDKKWTIHPTMEDNKSKAQAEGLWNLFLPKESDPTGEYGAGLTNVEYAFLCEIMGRSSFAPEAFNCSAPDTGNMEILAQFGTNEQKEEWLKPLLAGKIRSCFAMTEPDVASSDATNIQASIARDGDNLVLNGRKWWTSGALDPRMKLIVFMGKNDVTTDKHRQQSMVIVPSDSTGVKIVRALTVFGADDAPVGHGEVTFDNVTVPKSNVILDLGDGFKIAQARLGPGRIHHCMRMIGSAERSLDLMKERVQSRVTFGRPLVERDTVLQNIALSRIEIDQCRLLVLKTAHMMDVYGNKAARKEIAMIKVAVPNAVSRVIDRAMQSFGAAGLSGDFPLAMFYIWSRALRIADGPDEVHERTVAKLEMRNR